MVKIDCNLIDMDKLKIHKNWKLEKLKIQKIRKIENSRKKI